MAAAHDGGSCARSSFRGWLGAALVAIAGVAAVVCEAPAHGLGRAEKGDLSIEASGSVRLLAGFLHFLDDPLIFPGGDDGLGAAVGRILLDGGLASGVHYEVNLFSELSRTPGLSVNGSFATAGSFVTPYRSRYLSWSFWESGAMRGQLGVDRVSIKLQQGRHSLTFGRFPVNYSVTQVFTPNDFFAPFSATAVNRLYKPGVDAVQVGLGISPLASVELVGVVGNTPTGETSWQKSAMLLRASFVRWNFEWALLSGRLADRWMVGGSYQGNIGPIALRGEGHAGFPDRDADGRLDGPVHGRVATGLSTQFSWHSISIGAEYLYQSDGALDPSRYVERAGRFFPDDLPYLGQHYVGARIGGEIVPVLKTNAAVLVNAADGSGLALLSLAYDISDEAAFVGGVIVPWGARPVDAAPGRLVLGSEYGLTPLSAFLEMRFYF